MTDYATILAELDAAGSLEDVRDVLVLHGCKGIRKHPCACPLARYVRLKERDVPVTRPVQVGPKSLFLAGVGFIPLPPAVRGFVAAFDAGQYPELELESP